MKRKIGPSKKRPRSARPDPSTQLRTGPSARLRLRTEAAEVTGPLRPFDRAQGSAQASTRLRIETEMPLDAEDVALALLEAKVRAEEAQPKLGPAEALSGLTLRLPRAMILRLRAQAAERNVTPSRLVELSLAQYLPPVRPGRRRR